MPHTRNRRGPFARAVNGMPGFGQGRNTWWSAGGWKARDFSVRRSVPVDRLIATNTNDYLDEELVARYARRWFPPPVWVVECDGWFYIADGHHTAAAAISKGKRRVDARVKSVSRG